MAKDQSGSPHDGRGDGDEDKEARSGNKLIEADREGHSKVSRDRSHCGKSKRWEEEGSESSSEDSSKREEAAKEGEGAVVAVSEPQ